MALSMRSMVRRNGWKSRPAKCEAVGLPRVGPQRSWAKPFVESVVAVVSSRGQGWDFTYSTWRNLMAAIDRRI